MRSVILILFLTSSVYVFGQVNFQAITSVPLPDPVYEIAKGDFNNDGLPDFVTASFNGFANSQITLLLNTGTGTFTGTNVKNFAATTFVLDVAVGDFNEDNNLDVVTCSQSNDNFSLLFGDGNGNLGAPINFTAGDTPQGIAIGDMNKDGHLDVIVSCRGTPNEVHIFPGNGTGSFGSVTILPVPNVYDVAVADFNNDTNPDLAFSATNNTVQIWLGNGTGTFFSLLSTISSLNGGENILAANLDNDSDMDIICGGGYALNNGDGTFAPRVILPQTANEYAVGDINNDGKTDIIASDHNQNYTNMRVFLGDGGGTFTLLAKFEGRILFRGAEIADVNNDSHPDVIGAGNWSGTSFADIYLGDGTGYFSGVTKYPVTSDPRALAKGDFNEDGILDLAIAHNVGNIVSVYLGLGGGRFSKTGGNVSVGTLASELLTFDYNKDNHTDLVTFNYSTPPSVSILTGNGTGSFSLLSTINVATNSGGIALADFNNDTFVDIAIAGGTNNAVYLLNGTGSGFNAPLTVSVTGVLEDIEAADFNGDGNQDLAAVFSGPDNFLALTGNGSGGFTEGTMFAVPGTGSPGNIKIFDFNNDGRPDAAVSGSNTDEYFFTNNGSGSFTSFELPVTSGSNLGKDFADMDGDGIGDIIFGAQTSNSSGTGAIRAFKGNGTGTFGSSPLFNKQHSGGNQFITNDFNSDGKTDIAAVSFNIYEDYFSILINETAAACTSPSGTITPSSTVCVGQNVTIAITPSGTAPFTFQWKKGGTDISGATSQVLNFTPASAGDAGSYTCVITNACGNFTSAASVLTVQTSLTPPTTTGASSCVPAALTLTASGASNGQYRWHTTASGGLAIAGQTNSTFTTPVVSVTTTYYVSINNGTCESPRTPVVATIEPIASPTIFFDPPIFNAGPVINLCEGYVQKFSAPSGFSIYTWSNGESTEEITITADGVYSVTVEDAGGCVSPPSDPITVAIHPYPDADISLNGNQLTASSGDSYQWYHNGHSVSGATSQNFELNILEYGIYQVDVTSNGCTTRSPDFIYLITDYQEMKNNLKVYPNPFHHTLTIETSFPDETNILLIDALGRVVKKYSGSDRLLLFPVEEIKSGIYLLIIQQNNKRFIYKLEKKN